MTSRRRLSRRLLLSSLLGGVVVGSGCIDDADSASAETSTLDTGSTTTVGTTETTIETATETTAKTTTTAETTETTSATTTTGRPLKYDDLELRERPMLGNRNAPVTLVNWSDYRCPACQYFDLTVMPKIREKLVTSGKLRVIYKPVPLFGEKSELVARASHCVWNQMNDDTDAFWNWHDSTVETGDEESRGWADRETVVDLAESTDGASGDELESCLRSGKYGDRVSSDFEEAKDWDLEGTPHFLIFGDEPEDGNAFSGVPSYDYFVEAVEYYG